MSALVANVEGDGVRTVLLFMTKPPNLKGSWNDQERHMARCLDVPAAIVQSFLNRPDSLVQLRLLKS